ncbi:hypothetical protein [Kitasatospora terrestris]|uniref:Uncharacterized protein n=1 Tax=Kitasatospora terrestris TaxID=258051 RepID=A0ABP9ENE0_9ACTN
MEDVPQGGAGGVPLDDTDQKHPIHPPGNDGGPDAGQEEQEGDATTAEPGRARTLDPQETTDEQGEQPTES